jgi:hypothetical protein
MSNPYAYVELHTENPQVSKDFYRSLFDWKLSDQKMPDGKTYTMVEPGAGFPGGITEANGVKPQWVVYVQVDDIRSSTDKARKLGAKVLRDCVEIPEGTFSVLLDPAGSHLGLWQPKEKKP